jgi:RND family efflux transporter MFP subunit
MKRAGIALALGGALMLGAGGCGRSLSAAEPPIVTVPKPIVQVAKPERRTVERAIELPGDAQPYQQAMLYAKVSGYLRAVLVDKGDRVQAGQLLATIDSPEMRREAAQAQESAEGAGALAAGNTAARAGAVSDYRQAQAAVSKAQADLAAARAQVPKAEAERDAAAADVQKAIELQQQAQTAVAQAQAGLTQAKAEDDLNRQTYERLKRVYDRDPGLLARQDLDIAQSKVKASAGRVVSAEQAIEAARQGVAAAQQSVTAARSKQAAMESSISVAEAQIHTADQQVASMQAQAAAAKSQIGVVEAQGRNVVFQSQASQQSAKRAAEMLGYTQIRAPFAGTITQRFLDPGALVQSAANSAQGSTKPVLALADSDTVRVIMQVPEPDVPYVRPGTRAALRADALPGTKLAGRVTRTSGALDPGSRTMLVEIDLPNRRHLLHPGMFLKVTLDLEAHPGALTVPTSAVVFEKDKRSVFVVENGKAKKGAVKTGFEGAQWIEITSGLMGNEQVIAVGKENVSNGASVQVKETR